MERHAWRHRGDQRPAFAVEPKAGQESVWDYPRPPRLLQDNRLVEVYGGEWLVARTTRAVRVLETASPPTFYLPRDQVRMDLLQATGGQSYCEWKGRASYYDLRTDQGLVERVAWSYENPLDDFAAIAGHISFYPGRLACYVAKERVRPQTGGFYGGWITNEIVGPFKGDPGRGDW